MCERAPGKGQSGAGSRAGTRTREKGRGDRRGVLLLAERARRGGGWRAGHGAARLFGVSSGSSLHRRQPPSPAKQPSGPDGCRGAKSTSSCSFPHAVPRHWGALPTHARAYRCTLPLRSRKKKIKKKSKPKDAGILGEQGWRRCADSGVPLAAAGVRPPGSEAKSVSQSEEPGARGQRRQDLHPAHAPPLRPGARLCRQPFLTCRVSRAGGRERGRPADAGGEELGFGESDGRRKEEQRRCTAAEGGWSPQQSPRILR